MPNAGHAGGNAGAVPAEEWHFRNLAEHISQIVFVVTEQGHGEYFNAYWETYTGLSEGQSFDFG